MANPQQKTTDSPEVLTADALREVISFQAKGLLSEEEANAYVNVVIHTYISQRLRSCHSRINDIVSTYDVWMQSAIEDALPPL